MSNGNDYIDYSPWQTKIGRFLNMARIGLGENRGYIELHQDGRADLYSTDYPDEPLFQFNAEDGEMLISLGEELTAMMDAWKERQESQRDPDENWITNPAKSTTEPKAPEIVKVNGKAASAELQAFALK